MKRIIAYLMLAVLLTSAGCSKNDKIPPDPPINNPDDTSASDKGIPLVDDAIRDFMLKYNVPGISLAITKNDKLVYAKGYGFADMQTGEKVTTSSLFRVSSISKSITSATIFKLIEENKLTLSDKVFGNEGILGTDYGTTPYGQYITDITIDNLLHHTAGGWANGSGDPTMAHQTWSKTKLLSWILNTRPLNYPPGTKYMYSNVGYFILGRVIEKLTGKPYETYVKDSILKPMGITKMQIGGSTYEDRAPNEVRDHGQNGADPYKYNFPRRDANGGWIASATDLIRFMVHVDGINTVPDFLSPSTIKLMTTPSSANKRYACGWYVNSSGKWWHSGAFPGSSSYMIRTQGGYCGVLFSNTQSGKSGYWDDMGDLLNMIVNTTGIQWPDVDLFK